ncbi:MBL fold metallo-hydrolase [Actinoplanes friuliensis]|uniref:MBL fold metallo-hydrolase n=1 Tax=Actinoplanes friuliensis TaxID=196914 RepID=UPI000407FF68|nr:MBL fold metallo-hydrolase [Actinoplanes friuliensis]
MLDDPDVKAGVTFVGNATTLLRLGSFTLLTDPNFVPAGTRVYLGKGAWTRRLLDPAMTMGELPPLDGVVLSHLHGDHFDGVAKAELPSATPIFTTPQARRKLRQWKFRAVRGLPTWESYDWARGRERLRITAVPGRHGPGPAEWLLPDVMGSVIELRVDDVCRLRVYITGDTLNRPFLAQVPERCGDIDAMIVHLGGTRVFGMLLTMDARQGVDLTELIRPRLTVPVHHDDYTVFTSPLSDFVERAREHGLTGIQPIERGSTLELPVRPAGQVSRPGLASGAQDSDR